jgi:hypothetical protein
MRVPKTQKACGNVPLKHGFLGVFSPFAKGSQGAIQAERAFCLFAGIRQKS